MVAVVGDGALTGGMCWEALNNIAAAGNPLVIVVNDNGRSYAPTIGGLADHLASLRLNPGYEQVLDLVKESLGHDPAGRRAALRGAARGEEGHQGRRRAAGACSRTSASSTSARSTATTSPPLESALRRAKSFGGPVIVHAVTRKGYGYRPAEDDEADRLHARRRLRPETGKPLAAPSAQVDRRVRRRARRDRRRAARRRRHHRRDGRADRHRQARRASTPSGSTTSASPSSTPRPRRPASRWAACTRWSRSTRRSSTARSTRCCSTWRCTGCR